MTPVFIPRSLPFCFSASILISHSKCRHLSALWQRMVLPNLLMWSFSIICSPHRRSPCGPRMSSRTHTKPCSLTNPCAFTQRHTCNSRLNANSLSKIQTLSCYQVFGVSLYYWLGSHEMFFFLSLPSSIKSSTLPLLIFSFHPLRKSQPSSKSNLIYLHIPTHISVCSV